VSKSARVLVGPALLIDPRKLVRILVSPMQRARKTYELMFAPDVRENLHEGKVEFSADLDEWQYGDYEGMKTKEIRQLRERRGLDGAKWDHFRDGAEGGEYVLFLRELQKPTSIFS
jgi:broad specificity phosphatase PhoE